MFFEKSTHFHSVLGLVTICICIFIMFSQVPKACHDLIQDPPWDAHN
jgi:hypothetical protein